MKAAGPIKAPRDGLSGNTGWWCNGNMPVSKTVRSGFESLPSCQKKEYGALAELVRHRIANPWLGVTLRMFESFTFRHFRVAAG